MTTDPPDGVARLMTADTFDVTSPDDTHYRVRIQLHGILWRADINPTDPDSIRWFTVPRWGWTRDHALQRATTWMDNDTRYTLSRRAHQQHEPRALHDLRPADILRRATCCHSCPDCLPICAGTATPHGFYTPQNSGHLR